MSDVRLEADTITLTLRLKDEEWRAIRALWEAAAGNWGKSHLTVKDQAIFEELWHRVEDAS